MSIQKDIHLVLVEGESLTVEFKERMAKLDREIVAFANAAGGSIYLGVKDDGSVVGIDISNRFKSEIQDIARNCDPSIQIKIVIHKDLRVIEVMVAEGSDKPYRCTDGFFLRMGSNSQKLRRDEILDLINHSGKIRFDETLNRDFHYPNDFDKAKLDEYLSLCNINEKSTVEDILISIDAAKIIDKNIQLTNSAVLFFSKKPQQFFPESYFTCVRYQSQDRYSIMDKKDFYGSPIEQIEQVLQFLMGHMAARAQINLLSTAKLGQHQEIYPYPYEALREAVINAVTHRDYFYDGSHCYLHMYPDRIEIENPGGLYSGLTLDDLGKRSVRRNRLIADLLSRARFINRIGSGIDRMRQSLSDNNNPPYEVSASNFFNIRFYKRIELPTEVDLSPRQQRLYAFILDRVEVDKRLVAQFLGVSEDTALRELNVLIKGALVKRVGVGKATLYALKDKAPK